MLEQGLQTDPLRKYPPSHARQTDELTQKEHPIIEELQIEQLPVSRWKRDSHSVQTEADEHLLHPRIDVEHSVQVLLSRK